MPTKDIQWGIHSAKHTNCRVAQLMSEPPHQGACLLYCTPLLPVHSIVCMSQIWLQRCRQTIAIALIDCHSKKTMLAMPLGISACACANLR